MHVCIPASARVHTELYLFPFNTQTSQRSTTSLSPRLLGCLVRDLNYGPWPVTAGYIIRRMRIACAVTKDTDTHSEYLLRTAFPLQQRLGESA